MNAQECGFEPPENYETYEFQEQARIANSSFSVPENYCINVCFRRVFETNEFVIDDATLQSGTNYIVNLFTKEGGFTQQIIIVE